MNENTTTTDIERIGISRSLIILSVLFVVFVYFFGLNIPLLGPDEPRYAQVAREMLDSGDWITPRLGGYNWFEKPVLLYWLELLAFKIFGVNEFSARLGSAVSGLGIAVALWIVGRNIRPATDRSSAINFSELVALMAVSTFGIIIFSRGASFDIIVTFPLTAALVSFFIYDRCEAAQGSSTLPLASFYFFIGVGLLAKGLIGIVFPFAIVAFYHVLTRSLPRRKFIFSLVWGMAISVVVAATWYLPMYLEHGWAFIDEFIIQHHFQRYTSNKYQHPQPFYFYFWVLPLLTLPWLPFVFGGLWKGTKVIVKNDKADNGERFALYAFSIAWMIVPIAFFSLSGSKLPGYILPSVPPAIIIAALFAEDLISKSRRWSAAIMATVVLVFALVLGLLMFAVPKFADTDSVAGLISDANALGWTGTPVYGLHTTVHSAEFYAAGRLLRDEKGNQRKFYNPLEVADEMQAKGVSKALILVPHDHLKQLTDSQSFVSEVIRDNGEWALVGVRLKD